jgi:hypothetical protein
MMLVLLGALATALRAQPVDYHMTPLPDWIAAVTPGELDKDQRALTANGSQFLLSDVQVNLRDGQTRVYRRVVGQAVNANGVSELANLQFRFDPAYEVLELHAVNIIRDGRVMPRLDSATVHVLQREAELERQIFDGSKTANILLEDVRVGDIVDYAYSTSGRNPVFNGHDFGVIGMGFSVPVARIHARVITSARTKVAIAPQPASLEGSATRHGSDIAYEWDLHNARPVRLDDDAPSWHDPFPKVQWSEFDGWADVVDWALPLYAVPQAISPALQSEVDRILRAAPDAEGRLLAALRLAQGEIRYLGIEIGAGSHAPNPPDLVFERRFGDCKDKTLLTLTLLDRLGIKAAPALVSTGQRRALADAQPSPGQFDHVILRAELDGEPFWLDPTRDIQNATLENLVQPDFDLALVITPGTRDLVSMRRKQVLKSFRRIHVTYDARAGLDKPVVMRVETTLHGTFAEATRHTLANTSLDELQKQYLNFYATSFPGLTVAAPLTTKDDERNNRIVVYEHYRIAEFSRFSEAERRHTANVQVPDVDELLRGPASSVRNSPLRISHPFDVTVQTETLLPETWQIEPVSVNIEDPAFRFTREVKPSSNKVRVVDHFQTLVDEIAAGDIQRYAGNLSKARDETGYELYWTDPAASPKLDLLARVNWLVLMVGTLMLAILVGFAARIYRYDPVAPKVGSQTDLRGIAGWLLLPGFSLLATPILATTNLFGNIGVWSTESWASLTSPGGDRYHVLWAPALLLDLLGMLGVIVFAGLLLILFTRQRSSFPRIYIAYLWVTTIHLMISSLILRQIPGVEAFGPADVGVLLGSMTWTLYFLKSKRARNTFIRRLSTRNSQPAPLPSVPTHSIPF